MAMAGNRGVVNKRRSITKLLNDAEKLRFLVFSRSMKKRIVQMSYLIALLQVPEQGFLRLGSSSGIEADQFKQRSG
jgi:hypothetical protein